MTDAVTDQVVLVTGGAGFIGSHLVDALVEANEVRVLDKCSSDVRPSVPEDVTLIKGNIRDEQTLAAAMDGVDIVYNQAAQVSVKRSVEAPLDTHGTNGSGALRVLEHARRQDARAVFASSAAIYGHPDYVPVDERHPMRPTSPYGIDKLSVDHYVRAYHRLYDLPTVALRYFNVYGPRQTAGDYAGVIRIFLEQVLRGGPITVEGDGTQTRDFVHVSDVVQANLLAGTTEHVGRAFNIGSGTSITIRDLAETVRATADADVAIDHLDPRPGDIDHSEADISRAREELGYEPTMTLTDGLKTLLSSE